MENVDLNKNETIEYTEWLIATTDRDTVISQYQLRSAFEYFARDKEQLTNEDLFEALKTDMKEVDEFACQEILE